MHNGFKRLSRLCAAAAIALQCTLALAQTHPTQPIQLVVGFAPGGATDGLARILAPRLQEELGQPVIVENIPGANGNIAAKNVASSTANGFRLLVALQPTMTMNPFLLPKPGFDSLRDFSPIGRLATQCQLLVGSTKNKQRTLAELLAYGKANPGQLSLAGSQIAVRLSHELLNTASGAGIVYVPTRGSPQNLQLLMSGDVQMSIGALMPNANYVEQGQVVGLALFAPKRDSRVPQVPTAAELGWPTLTACDWAGVFGPAQMAPDVVQKLGAAIRKALASKEFERQAYSAGWDLSPSTAEQLGAQLRSDLEKNGALLKQFDLVDK